MTACVFCGKPADPLLGRYYGLAMSAATTIYEYDEAGAQLMTMVMGGLSAFKMGHPEFGETVTLFAGRAEVVVHPGCHADWAYERKQDRRIEQAEATYAEWDIPPEPDVEVGFGQVLPPRNGMDTVEPDDVDLIRDMRNEHD
ncbi:MAG: hypothetical protein ABIJ75_10605 [Actinomycetota bacterium]